MAEQKEKSPIKKEIDQERNELLVRIEEWLDGPVLFLGFVWLILIAVQLIWGLNRFLQFISAAIWVLFIIDFLLRFILAPEKTKYLKQNWLNAVSLFLPALRVLAIFRFLQFFRAAGALRGLQLIKLLGSLNRGLDALRLKMKERGFLYVIILTTLVIFAGSAGMLAFEQGNKGFMNYGDSLWFTAMLVTTVGSEAWPKSVEGRVLAFIISLYALGVLGYLAATFASFFIGQDTKKEDSNAPVMAQLEEIKKAIEDLKEK